MLKKIKFCIAGIFAVCLFSAGNTAFAAPICPVPTEVTQPDGSVITVTAYGDEFFSWREDENGNVIVYDEETDSYKYAEIEDGKLVPTSEMVGDTSLLRSTPKRLQREDVIPLWENAERVDYIQPSDNSGIALMSAGVEPEQEKPLTRQKLLTLLIEFNDVKLVQTSEFWQKRMFSKNPKDISVVNYWKENANGLDIFEPADTSNVQDGAVGTVSLDKYSGTTSWDEYVDIGYTITKCPEGVVKVSLDMPHPIRTWSRDLVDTQHHTAVLALRAVEPYLNFEEQRPNLAVIFAGYEAVLGQGDGKGQIRGNVQEGFILTSDGINLGKYMVQGEMITDDCPAGIGVTCHELGHSVFNLPDLYFGDLPSGGYGLTGLTLYSLMSLGCWGHLYNDGKDSEHNIWNDPYAQCWSHVPTHLDPWCKTKLGYVIPELVNEWDGDVNSISERGVDSQYNVLAVRSRTNANQCFLVENRQLIGYDSGLEQLNANFSGENRFGGGIVIYHVDEDTDSTWNNNSLYHRFISVEQSDHSEVGASSAADWVYTNKEGRNQFTPTTTPNSNLYQLRTLPNPFCSKWKDCHPQTEKSGISIEVLGEIGSSMRVTVDIDKDYHLIMKADVPFKDLFPDENFCRAVLDMLREETGVQRTPASIPTLQDWITMASSEYLVLDGYGIKDLTGIGYFPILEVLDCFDNEIEELTYEQSPKLVAIGISNNKLKKLDVSKWVNLTYLECESNLLTELDVTNNVHLYELWCSENHLTKLDTSKNPELWELECCNNQLTELDFTNNPNLAILKCYENYLDPETPKTSIKGLEVLLPKLGPALSKDDPDNWFAYYPQNIPDTKHNWDSVWQKDDTHHWHNCTDEDCPIANDADKNGYGEHTWDSGNVTKQPTCSAAGVKTYTCSVCQAIKTEEIAATGIHTPGEWETVTPATTKQVGLRVKKCTVCNAELERETLPKLKPNPGPSRPSTPHPVEPDPGLVEPTLPDNPADCPKDENCPMRRYTDINIEAWYHDGIHFCVENGLMNGEGNEKFAPNAVLTRGMLAQILYNKAGRAAVTGNSAFADVESGVWYANAVVWAAENGIVSGYGNGRFGPNDPITREQLAVMLYRHAGSPTSPNLLLPFDDAENVSDYALDALRWAVEKDIMNGKGNGILDPKGRATRAEVAAMLQRYLTLER